MTLDDAVLLRICRDLAWSEINAMPGMATRLGQRVARGEPAYAPD